VREPQGEDPRISEAEFRDRYEREPEFSQNDPRWTHWGYPVERYGWHMLRVEGEMETRVYADGRRDLMARLSPTMYADAFPLVFSASFLDWMFLRFLGLDEYTTRRIAPYRALGSIGSRLCICPAADLPSSECVVPEHRLRATDPGW
jgi:hypothetical protein